MSRFRILVIAAVILANPAMATGQPAETIRECSEDASRRSPALGWIPQQHLYPTARAKLNARGIYTLAQLSAMSWAEQDETWRTFATVRKIELNDWVKQAENLVAQGKGNDRDLTQIKPKWSSIAPYGINERRQKIISQVLGYDTIGKIAKWDTAAIVKVGEPLMNGVVIGHMQNLYEPALKNWIVQSNRIQASIAACSRQIDNERVYFETGDAEFKDAKRPVLAECSKLPNVRIRVHGHADLENARGKKRWLSEQRAKLVAHDLTTRDFRADQVCWKGFAHDQPLIVNPRSTKEQDRRVEFVLDVSN